MIETKFKKNYMTQKYYTNKILSIYVVEYQRCRTLYDKVILQKNNDDSYDIEIT